MSKRSVNIAVAVITYAVALATALFLIVSSADAAPFDATDLYMAESLMLTCPENTSPDWSADGLTMTCRSRSGAAHGWMVEICKGVFDSALPRRSFTSYRSGVPSGWYKHRPCTAHSTFYEEEGYYNARGQKHGLVVWRNRKGTVLRWRVYANGVAEKQPNTR